MAMRDLLWAKFWVGTLPLLGLALGIVGVTNALLQVDAFIFAVSLMTITGLTFGLAGLAIGMGTLFPQYETENAAQIPTSFGGLVFMMSAVGLIGLVVVLEARPVFGYFSAIAFHREAPSPVELWVGFGLAGLACVLATLVPIRVALHRLESGERT
jgi:ABC-2 type transport system permease protein